MDSNYVNIVSPSDTAPASLRRSLLGALRYGKPLVLDFLDVDAWDMLPQLFEAVHPGMLDTLFSGQVRQEASIAKLVRPEDGDEYTLASFSADRLDKFRFVVVTSQRNPFSNALQHFCVYRVKMEA